MKVTFRKRKSNAPRFENEPEELSTLLLAKMKQSVTGPPEMFVKHRFWRPFEHSITWAKWYSIAFSVFTVLVIAGGVASSLLSQTSWPGRDTLIAIAGIAVAVLAAVNRLWRPGLRAAVRHRAANELRREGWAFVCEEGHYKNPKVDRLGTFFSEVERINAPAEAVDEQQVENSGET